MFHFNEIIWICGANSCDPLRGPNFETTQGRSTRYGAATRVGQDVRKTSRRRCHVSGRAASLRGLAASQSRKAARTQLYGPRAAPRRGRRGAARGARGAGPGAKRPYRKVACKLYGRGLRRKGQGCRRRPPRPVYPFLVFSKNFSPSYLIPFPL